MSNDRNSPKNPPTDTAHPIAPPAAPAGEQVLDDLAAPLTLEQEDKVRGGLFRSGGDGENTLYGIRLGN